METRVQGMPKEQSPGKPTSRRYSPEEKAAAVRMVRALRSELGADHGTVGRVARQLGYGVESVRCWARQADIDDGYAPGVSTAEVLAVELRPEETGGSLKNFLDPCRLLLLQEPRTQARQ